jgi:hypothetical protein
MLSKVAQNTFKAQKADPRGTSNNPSLPGKCQLWLQGLPAGTVCPRLAAPVPVTCAFACQPLLHTAPVTSIVGQLQLKYLHAEGTNAHSYSRPSVTVSSQQPCARAHCCQWKKTSLTTIAAAWYVAADLLHTTLWNEHGTSNVWCNSVLAVKHLSSSQWSAC